MQHWNSNYTEMISTAEQLEKSGSTKRKALADLLRKVAEAVWTIAEVDEGGIEMGQEDKAIADALGGDDQAAHGTLAAAIERMEEIRRETMEFAKKIGYEEANNENHND